MPPDEEKLIRRKLRPFHGDFRQILPVIEGGSRAQILFASIRSSALFSKFQFLEQTANIRLKTLREDPLASRNALEFPGYLLRLGEGCLPTTEEDFFELPEAVSTVSTVAELCVRIPGSYITFLSADTVIEEDINRCGIQWSCVTQ